ncbi:hypothetical protein [Mucilaginibacter myungsuensis]|uniref:Entericidin n=1 Tax=Mucilaginibacter myungsuensis TaxID=649104 RepID=A0A929PVF3_9SPHI|nr:hypothetical protein [Mucilaginibacter myungsuensis]MBE9660951.1 hypothetical protein [Mucilaginibacter myungsuensis]MDN3600997.1 hypothetical protein [Mucilaginibacter myungsuensis]
MKNAFKFGFLALAITLAVSACGGDGSKSAADSAAVADSLAKADSIAPAVANDSLATDSAATDSAATDTTKKM